MEMNYNRSEESYWGDRKVDSDVAKLDKFFKKH